MVNRDKISGSFRDPSGFLFHREGKLYRQVNQTYREHYDYLIGSGLYRELVDGGLLIPHEEKSVEGESPALCYKVIQPEEVPFISYPYEWCFSQLKDAALTTLEVQKRALDFGMILKDSSAYNIQFRAGRPLLIDTLSFRLYREGEPWPAYRQFCQHFLAPLALMSLKDVRLSQLLRIFIDGIPLDLASSLLPFRGKVKPSLLTHINLHAKSQKHYSAKSLPGALPAISKRSLINLMENLEAAVQSLMWAPVGTAWAHYDEEKSYSSGAFDHKKQVVGDFLDRIRPQSVWDLGANTGIFSRLAGDRGIQTLSFDMDPAAVEINYLDCKKDGEMHVLPLWLDLTNPSPGIGWDNRERMPLSERGPTDAIIALALLHHLVISSNIPFEEIARSWKNICEWLIIEFIPGNDARVQQLMAGKSSTLSDYTRETFESIFKQYFMIVDDVKVKDSGRTIYLMKKRHD